MRNIPNLDILSQCSVCQAKIERRDILIVHKEGGRTIFHSTCSRCKALSILVITDDHQKGIIGVGMATDLDRTEFSEKFLGKSITTDEIIDVYEWSKSLVEKK